MTPRPEPDSGHRIAPAAVGGPGSPGSQSKAANPSSHTPYAQASLPGGLQSGCAAAQSDPSRLLRRPFIRSNNGSPNIQTP